MKTGICQICKKEFKLTKSNKLWRHGYKQEIVNKRWPGYLFSIIYRFYKLTQAPCKGSGLPAIKISDALNLKTSSLFYNK